MNVDNLEKFRDAAEQLKKKVTVDSCAAFIERSLHATKDLIDEIELLQSKLQDAESKLKLIDGISQDAIDGGWTAYGLSSYAKSLEKNNAELHERLNNLINSAQSNADKVEIEKEDRKMLLYLMNAFDTENWNCPSCTHVESTSEMDSAYFLREYLAKSTK